METYRFRFEKGNKGAHKAQLVGVVSSGNLEVLIEPFKLNGACEIEVKTPVGSFEEIWTKVMEDFHSRWQLTDTRLFINDMGATPAVVSLRLDQAAAAFLKGGG